MKHQTTLTAVIGTYNRVERLKKVLPIYLSTKRKDVKFLILNDCSTDNTKNYINEYMKKDHRISLINQNNNKHIFLNYIDGFKQVDSPYAMWLSDDDYMEGDYIDKCIQIFEKYPSVGIVHNKVNKVSINSTIDYELFNAGEEALRNIFLQGQSHPGLAYRTKAINFNDFDKPEGQFGKNIYPVDRINLAIAKKYDLVICHKQGMKEMDKLRVFKDVFDEKRIFQKRTADYNISELSLNKFEMLDLNLFNEYCYKFTKWVHNTVITNLSDNEYKIFLRTVSKTTIGKYHILFFIRTLFFRFNLLILLYTLKNLFNLYLFKYNYFSIKFLLTKIFKFLLIKINKNK